MPEITFYKTISHDNLKRSQNSKRRVVRSDKRFYQKWLEGLEVFGSSGSGSSSTIWSFNLLWLIP